MEILVFILGFYLINFVTNHLAAMSPFLSGIVYFVCVMLLFNFINRMRLNRFFHSKIRQQKTQNKQFQNWDFESSSKKYPSDFKIREDIIEAEYTEKEIQE